MACHWILYLASRLPDSIRWPAICAKHDFYATEPPGRRRKVIHRKIDGLRRDGVRKVSLTSRANTASLMHPLNSAFELLNRLMALPRVRLRCTRKTSLAWQANLAICCRWLAMHLCFELPLYKPMEKTNAGGERYRGRIESGHSRSHAQPRIFFSLSLSLPLSKRLTLIQRD